VIWHFVYLDTIAVLCCAVQCDASGQNKMLEEEMSKAACISFSLLQYCLVVSCY